MQMGEKILMINSVRFGHATIYSKTPICRKRLLPDCDEFEGLQMSSTFLLGDFVWKFWTETLISKLLRSVEPKLSYHLNSDRNFWNFWYEVNNNDSSWN